VITATGLHLATETTRYAPQGTPVTVVPYGVDLDMFSPGTAPAGNGETVVIGTVARLSPEKGVTYLIDAFATLRRRYGARVLLRVAGDGPERSRLEAQIARLGMAGAIELHGWVEHAMLPQFLRGLDLFAVPSTWEGFGVAAAEASACGLPIVSTDVHGLPDVVRHNATGLLVPPRQPDLMAGALTALVEDAEQRRKLGAAGREYIAAHYDWRTNAAQMESIYARVVSSGLVGAAS
jgi:glycosyltransferase involved in cell wall biosynthesis